MTANDSAAMSVKPIRICRWAYINQTKRPMTTRHSRKASNSHNWRCCSITKENGETWNTWNGTRMEHPRHRTQIRAAPSFRQQACEIMHEPAPREMLRCALSSLGPHPTPGGLRLRPERPAGPPIDRAFRHRLGNCSPRLRRSPVGLPGGS